MTDEQEREQHLERLRAAVDRKAEEARAEAEEHGLEATERPQDEMSVRAKNSGHAKKTADKWNE